MREPALRAAVGATQVLEGTTNLSVSVIVGQIRSTATDLLTGIGMTLRRGHGGGPHRRGELAAPPLTGRPAQSAPAKRASYVSC